MAYTTLQLANLALSKLGEDGAILADFTGTGSITATILREFYKSYGIVTKRDDWSWARKTVELAINTVLTQYTEFTYVYDLPSDLAQIRSVYGYGPAEIVYRLEQGYLFTDYETYTDSDSNVYPRMIYTMNTVEVSGGYPAIITGYEALITDEFATAFGARLAWDIAMAVTGSEKKRDAMRNEYLGTDLPEAQQINAESDPGYGPQQEDWSEIQE